MGCPSEVFLGDDLTFSICTHDPDTGRIADADSLPTYRVYEDETATPVATGTMAKFDDANTTGFYIETLECTTANGYEAGKSYTIYIEATVDSDTGGISYAFKAVDVFRQILQQVNLIQPDTEIIAVSPIITGTTLQIVAGATYLAADGQALRIAISAPVDSNNVCSLAIGTQPTPGQPESTKLLAVDGVFVEVDEQWYASFDITAAQTETLPISKNSRPNAVWDLIETLSDGSIVPIVTQSHCSIFELIPRT